MPSFEDYLNLAEVEDGLRKGVLIKGTLRVGANSPGDAFCVRDSSTEGDVYIEGKWDRNRAFHGDTVTVKLTSNESAEQARGKVVYVNSCAWEMRTYVCSLQPNQMNNDSSGLVSAEDKLIRAVPIDKRIPWILIQLNDVVKRALRLPGPLDPTQLYPIQVLKWAVNSSLPLGRLKGDCLGKAGEVATEEMACLIESDLLEHAREFPPAVHAEVSALLSGCSTTTHDRTDFRQARVMTIDPATARDLDDAIHILRVDEHTVEIGVHIADVSHYVKPGTQTDAVARDRCTSVYLCHKVLPMLPEQLSNGVCSLTANEDKLTFSCWFRVDTRTGDVVPGSERFAKSVINSCCRFNYEQVQDVIDKKPFPLSERPVTYRGVTWDDLVDDLFLVYDVCGKVRKNRFENGSMKINKQKMRFKLDQEDLPVSYQMEEHTESHWMIEELMLLANKLVSVFITTASDFDPSLQACSVLRRHPCPEAQGIKKVAQRVKDDLGIDFEYSNSRSLYDSLLSIRSSKGDDVANLIEFLVMKTMRPAEYIPLDEAEDARHFALSFDSYTHFTSPIRRYADILVHRQLEYCLKQQAGMMTLKEISDLCELCNIKKRLSRLAQEACDVAFFCMFLRSRNELQFCRATVCAVMEKQVVVFIPQIGKECPVFYKLTAKFPGTYLPNERALLGKPVSFDQAGPNRALATWNDGRVQELKTLDAITVALVPLETVPISFTVLLTPPSHRMFGKSN